MKLVFHPGYAVDLGKHPFRTEKYPLLKEAIERELGLREFHQPRFSGWGAFEGFLVPEYLEDLREARLTWRTERSELPVRPDVIYWQAVGAQGTWLAVRLAKGHGCAFHIGGGLHHAFPHHAEGFCYINDVAYGAWRALREGLFSRIAVVDLDLHQGNGTAYYFTEFFRDPRVFTLSIHEEENYPWPKEKSTLDIGLQWRTPPETYFELLEKALKRVEEWGPDLVIYQAGVDVYREDLLGHQVLREEDIFRRDTLVFEAARRAGAAVAITLGGGYPPSVEKLVELHLGTARACLNILR